MGGNSSYPGHDYSRNRVVVHRIQYNANPQHNQNPQNHHHYQHRPAPQQFPGPGVPARPAPIPSPGVSSASVKQAKLDAFLRKDTVKLERTGTDQLKFAFSSETLCRLTVYYFARETAQNVYQVEPQLPEPTVLEFGPGEHEFSRVFISINSIPPNKLVFVDGRTYPLVIEISPVYSDANKQKQTQITCFLIKKEGRDYSFKSILQKVVLGTKTIHTQDVYGIAGVNKGDGECIICMSEPPNTTVLPCGHMCLCKVCAELLREQREPLCPICREQISEFKKLMLK